MSSRALVDVAVGVLRRADGRFLLASRPEGKPYAHYWEFPGGKLEPGEGVAHALSRELHEELGIHIGAVRPWIVREFEYPHAHVRLHFCRVNDWRGEPHPHEGQTLRFCTLDDLPQPLLPATIPVLRWLALPERLAISNAFELGVDGMLARLQFQLDRGLRQLLFREPQLDIDTAHALFDAMLARSQAAGARLLVSSRHPLDWARQADGCHLTSRDLMSTRQRPVLPWVGASVHGAAELARAAALDLDYVTLGPVLATRSHPGNASLGWERFGELALATPVPLYALGGLSVADLQTAQARGAHGIALQRGAWLDH